MFCGSSFGNDPAYRQAAEALGAGLARAGIRVVYGGGRIGLMGALANAALAAGGQVVGVLPDFLRTAEVAHDALTRLEITDSMHTRKRRMFELADAFIALPGGIGTLEETVEILTWRQLRQHAKPILICDIAGSARGLVGAIDAAVAAGFVAPALRDAYAVIDGVAAVLARLASLRATPPGARGLRRAELILPAGSLQLRALVAQPGHCHARRAASGKPPDPRTAAHGSCVADERPRAPRHSPARMPAP